MKYNFDEVIDRTNTNSLKWDGLEKLYGDKELLPLWVADMDFKAPQPVIDAIKKQAEHGVYGYTITTDSFYEPLIAWLKKRHNWEVEKEWLTFSPGIVPALSVIIRAFSDPGDKIIVQTPVYYPFFKVAKQNEREVIENELHFDGTHYTMDFEDLERKMTPDVKLLILSNPHNPVGRVWTKEELIKLGEICRKHNVLIISDEIHCDLIRKGYTHTPLAAISEELRDHSITCLAPSKTFNLAGLYASTLVIPNHDHRMKFQRLLQNQATTSPNTFAVPAFEAAYREGEEWLEQLLDYLEDNLTFLKNFVNERIPNVEVVEPEGTYLIWLNFRKLGLDSRELKKLIQKEAKVALNEGYTFGSPGEGFERINIACPRSILEEALVRIEKAIKKID
ncbi:MalY/PatB family protein [Bacillus taeanensis]|uniref:cysteine-S-conjugate beta-lyase n=1 Tax=Bacillus taeanensis TaxID=273032 RepID=A0A366XP86_9BACI|nr:MalY/PatB family protein [Bacillus taeanensis]RBW68180.1 cystathionine beta-lyase [Bacillus taeanensis]